MNLAKPSVRVAVLGCGTVGSQVVRLLLDHSQDLNARTGARLELVGVAVEEIATAPVPQGLDKALLTEDAIGLAQQADVVVELMGGIEPARSAILAATQAGASVVSANKALLAADGPTLFQAATEAKVDLYYEAAVAAAIPILRAIQESLAGDSVTRVLGIVNGTTNYVLDRMTLEGLPFDEVVDQARQLGYAEADPTADVEGYDAAAKAAILASLAFHSRVSFQDVYHEGITHLTQADIAAAAATGHVIKLLAITERVSGPDGQDRGIVARVHPALISQDHPLASVHGPFNAVFVESEAAGDLMFYGQGAGGKPTASAVVGDIVTAARHKAYGGRGPGESAYLALPVLDVGQAITRYQIRLEVTDRPGVLAQVASVVAQHQVSIEAVHQTARQASDGPVNTADLTVVTHHATEKALSETVVALAQLPVVVAVEGVLRVEGE
ncbi:MAG: homoserine dehydrogenase [Micrococcales bacterium]|nr:homoserine dehydrogenase [Micrococcales bacterium]